VFDNIIASYPNLYRTFHVLNPRSKSDDNEENKYNISGRDFLFDILFLSDLFGPLIKVMIRLQKLCPHLESIHFDD